MIKHDKCEVWETEVSRLRQIIKDQETQLKIAEDMIEDFILESEHSPRCNSHQDKGFCDCMDRTYFNKQILLDRAKIILKWDNEYEGD